MCGLMELYKLMEAYRKDQQSYQRWIDNMSSEAIKELSRYIYEASKMAEMTDASRMFVMSGLAALALQGLLLERQRKVQSEDIGPEFSEN